MTIGFEGDLSIKSNVEVLIYILDDLRYELPDLELLIIGKGGPLYEQYLRDEAERFGLENRIKFAAWQNENIREKAVAECFILFRQDDLKGKSQEEINQMILKGLLYDK